MTSTLSLWEALLSTERYWDYKRGATFGVVFPLLPCQYIRYYKCAECPDWHTSVLSCEILCDAGELRFVVSLHMAETWERNPKSPRKPKRKPGKHLRYVVTDTPCTHQTPENACEVFLHQYHAGRADYFREVARTGRDIFRHFGNSLKIDALRARAAEQAQWEDEAAGTEPEAQPLVA